MAVTDKKIQESNVKKAMEEAKAKAAKEEKKVKEGQEEKKAKDVKEEEVNPLEEEVIDTADEPEDLEESKDVIEGEFEEIDADILEDDDNKNASQTEDGKDGKKSLFGKKKKDKRDEKIEELTDRLTRQMAEFDNFRKRSEKEKSHMYEIGAKDIIDKLLPVVDNFERGFEAIEEGDRDHPFIEGMDKVYKHLMTTLESIGVKQIEAVGEIFNPDFHNAVMHIEDENYGENTVVEEFQKGYTYRDTVVRYSMVKVAN
jgi:molecular chaperone GrpE